MQFRLRDSNAKLSAANDEIRLFNQHLEALVDERTAEMLVTRDIAVTALASLAESRDPKSAQIT